jgi:hypothetical protein
VPRRGVSGGLVIADSPGVEVLHVKQIHGRPALQVRNHPASIAAPADRSSTWRRHHGRPVRMATTTAAGPVDWRPARVLYVHSLRGRPGLMVRGLSSLFCPGPFPGAPRPGLPVRFRGPFSRTAHKYPGWLTGLALRPTRWGPVEAV